MAVNYPSERSFGEITGQLQSCGKKGLTNAVGVSQVRVNSYLLRGFDTGFKKNNKWVEGIFHKLSEDMRVSLVNIYIEDVPEARADDQLDLSKQQTVKS